MFEKESFSQPRESLNVAPDDLLTTVVEKTENTIFDRIKDPTEAAEKWGLWFHRSGMFGVANAEAGMVIALTCMCEKITPINFQRTYHIIRGRPTMQADAMLAEFRNRGGRHKEVEVTPEKATIELTDWHGNSNTFSVSWEEAKEEIWTQEVDKKTGELQVKQNWQGPISRQDMLWHTVCKRAVRRMAPEIAAGIYTPEEAEQYPLPHPPLAEQPKKVTASDAAEIMKQPGRVNGRHGSPLRANDVQVASILQLFQQLEFPVDKIDAALAKRGVIKVSLLTPDQADEMIEKLQGMVAEKN